VGDNLDLHVDYKDVISHIGLPWFNVMGNHDMNYDAAVDSLSDETFERNFGPNTFAFNYGNVHFIILDDIIYPNPYTNKGYIGGFRESQLDFVENNLKYVSKDKLIVLSYHIPLFTDEKQFIQKDRQRLFDILADFPNVLGLSAHTHFQTQYFYGKEQGWKGLRPFHEYNVGTTNGDWYSGIKDQNGVPISVMRDGTPKGYVFLNFKDNAYDFDYKVAGKSPDYQIEIAAPQQVYEGQVHRIPIYANFFVGSKVDKLSYRIAHADWKDMTYVETVDPLYQNNLYKWDLAEQAIEGRRPSSPEISTHLWTSNLPKLKAGSYTIEVRAKDMFGKTFYQKKTIEVLAVQ